MDISFAILTWNSEKYLERCLACINQALKHTNLSYEICVLDNGSQDSTPALLEKLSDKYSDIIVPHFEQKNIGTTRSRNHLFTTAHGDYLCVMDSDVELGQGVLEVLLTELESDQRVGIVVPRILYPSGTWQKSFDRFPTVFDKINRLFRLRSIEAYESLRYSESEVIKSFYVDYAISAFWLMRRKLLETVGLLDEQIFYSPEDVDFCLRIWKSGYRVLYVPSVSVVHHTQEISRGLKINMAKLSHIKGLLYYFYKHHYFLRRPSVGCHAADIHDIS